MRKRKKTAFGDYLVQEIKKAGISQEAFYKAVGITKPYFYDLLNSTPPPPEIQKKMLVVLDENASEISNRRTMLLNLAAQGRDEIPTDIAELIKANPSNWDRIRKTLADITSESASDNESRRN